MPVFGPEVSATGGKGREGSLYILANHGSFQECLRLPNEVGVKAEVRLNSGQSQDGIVSSNRIFDLLK